VNAVKQIAMKTKLNLTVVLFFLITIIPAGRNVLATTTGKDTLAVNTISVSLPVAEDESYVDDIPFDTKEIALKSLFMGLMQPEEEAYVNDIPFDTEEIAAVNNNKLLSFQPQEEEYIDDIPFETAQIVSDYNLNLTNMAAREKSDNCDD
jgi:hypothetical protein